jgi:hypothetical protein
VWLVKKEDMKLFKESKHGNLPDKDGANGGNSEIGLFADGFIGEDHPLALLTHDCHLAVEKVGVLKGRFVGAALHSGLALHGGPVRSV